MFMADDVYIVPSKGGDEWIPEYANYVDRERCVGCGMCVRMCFNRVYEMQVVDGKEVAVVVNDRRCFGDCHCHTICPVEGGAMVCKSKAKTEFPKGIEKNHAFNKAGEPWKQDFVVSVDEKRCTGCRNCVRLCQRMVFDMVEKDGRIVAEAVLPDLCMGDLHCVGYCKPDAIKVETRGFPGIKINEKSVSAFTGGQ
jgi:NAD-dependent dihydropyrimidine dehydrogenase PreA subunit